MQYISVNKLKPFEKNPRQISATDFEKLKQDLQQDRDFFADRPCLVNKQPDGKLVVYAGNQRLRAAKALGWDTVPCIIRDDIAEETMRRRAVKDNLHRGSWDYDLLANEWEVEDLIDWGFSEEQLTGLKEAEQINAGEEDEEEHTPDETATAITQLGDLYELGDHRLICGDSTMPDVVEKVLAGAEPILMVTDPPYGVNYDASWRKDILDINGKKQNTRFGKVENDNQNDWRLSYSLFPGDVAYIWCASLLLHRVAQQIEDAKFELKTLLVWNKHSFSLSRGDYHWKHEPCWYAVRKGNPHNWQGSRNQCSVWDIDSLQSTGSTNQGEKREDRTEHSTQKPLECMARPIRNNSAEGEGVYDPFLGSGTTLIAAEQLKRKCYAIELSPIYVDIAVNRWIKYRQKNNLPTTFKRNGIELNELK